MALFSSSLSANLATRRALVSLVLSCSVFLLESLLDHRQLLLVYLLVYSYVLKVFYALSSHASIVD